MGLGDRRARQREERETFGRGGSAQRYRIREKMISIGGDHWIEDEEGDRVIRVDGKAFRLRKTFHLEDPQGRLLCTIQKRVMHIRDFRYARYVIESAEVRPGQSGGL